MITVLILYRQSPPSNSYITENDIQKSPVISSVICIDIEMFQSGCKVVTSQSSSLYYSWCISCTKLDCNCNWWHHVVQFWAMLYVNSLFCCLNCKWGIPWQRSWTTFTTIWYTFHWKISTHPFNSKQWVTNALWHRRKLFFWTIIVYAEAKDIQLAKG